MVKRTWINPDPFQFISELHDKMHDGYEPTQEDIDEVVRLMQIVFDVLKPILDEWIEAINHFFNYIVENLEYMDPEIREKLEAHGKPIVTHEAGVEQKEPEPEKPMGHPHTSYAPGIQYVYIPPDYKPFYDRMPQEGDEIKITFSETPHFNEQARARIDEISRRLDRGTES